tara:strand:- start:666 stop:1097 length:432 start_codon:yes stop_codon:yes gene_type:complete
MTKEEKRKSRVVALQALYAFHISSTTIDQLLDYIKSNEESEEIIAYAKSLSMLAIDNLENIDAYIVKNAHNWEFDRISLIDKLVLRLSLAEMIYEDSVPPKVSIVEGVEIAKEFGTENSGSFVNGILDSVYNKIVNSEEKDNN